MVVALTTIVGVAAFLIGRGVRTPAQEAARAAPPTASLLTAPVLRRSVRTVIVLRGTLRDAGAMAVDGPVGTTGNLPVVSAVATGKGAVVQDGSLIAAVADRPVVVMQGLVPAYGAMHYGSTGVNVTELQQGLIATGHSTGLDEAGHYGSGTAAAVAELYARVGYPPIDAPGPSPSASQGAKAKAKPTQYATVPQGEIAFVPKLPGEVVAVARLGATLSSSTPLAKLANGRLTFRVATDTNTGALLRRGVLGRAVSDIDGGSFPIKLIAKRTAIANGSPRTFLTFVPAEAGAAGYVGQNLALRVRTGQHEGRHWVVPVSAVVTTASGASSVTVVSGTHQQSLRVRAGLVYQGSEVITPLDGGLHVGEQVSVGRAGGTG